MKKSEKFKRLAQILSNKCPVAFPVIIKRVKMRDYGTCCLWKKKFYITVKENISEDDAIATLIHEWAHARAWSYYDDSMTDEKFYETCHDAKWGVAYSEVYTTYEKYFLIDKTKVRVK